MPAETDLELVLDNLRNAIPKARQDVYDTAAMFYENESSPPPGWRTYKPFFEMVFYLGWLDYLLKVQIHRLIEDSDNRAIGESELSLTLYEAVEKLPRAASMAYACIMQKPKRAPIRIDEFRNAQEAYKQTLKEITSDHDFKAALRLVRNGVSAHHGFDKGKGGEHLVGWVLATTQSEARSVPVTHSLIFSKAVDVGRAVQEFGRRLKESLS